MDIVVLSSSDILDIKDLIALHMRSVEEDIYIADAVDWLQRELLHPNTYVIAAKLDGKYIAYIWFTLCESYTGPYVYVEQTASTNHKAMLALFSSMEYFARQHQCDRITGHTPYNPKAISKVYGGGGLAMKTLVVKYLKEKA